jgi:hypothetical protein
MIMEKSNNTYAEEKLKAIGFETLDKDIKPTGEIDSVTMATGEFVVKFTCVCPAPSIRKLGCPVHHDGPGGSWPVTRAAESINKK